MRSHFQKTVEAHKALIPSEYYVSRETDFFKGDREVGQFFIHKEFQGSDHSKGFDTLIEIRNQIAKLFQVELKPVSSENWSETHTGTVKGLSLEITITYNPLSTWGTGRIYFKFVGKKLETKKNYTQYLNVALGSVFYASWGHDMTICDFFQVVRRSGNTIYTRRLKTQIVDGCEYGHKVPVVNNFDCELVFRSKLGGTDDNTYAYINNKYAVVWDGNKKYFNSLD